MEETTSTSTLAKKKIIIIIVIILLFALGVMIFFIKKHKSPVGQNDNQVKTSGIVTINPDESHVNPPGGETNIPIADGKFDPEMMTVGTGTQVNWVNQDDSPHSIVSDSGAFKSDKINKGQYYFFTFTTPGEYKYHDGLNPNVKATLVVVDIPQPEPVTPAETPGEIPVPNN